VKRHIAEMFLKQLADLGSGHIVDPDLHLSFILLL
jgi:hypothetical protein